MGLSNRDRQGVGGESAVQDDSDPHQGHLPAFPRACAPRCLEPTEFLVLLQRRREFDQRNDRIAFTGFDVCHPDGRPLSVGMRRFCQQGTRLLLGRARQAETALVRITLVPVAEPESRLTSVGRGVRSRRFFALRNGDEIRFHFLDGTPTEIVFHDRLDDPAVLSWLRADHIRPGIPFWFDLACQLEANGNWVRPIDESVATAPSGPRGTVNA